MENPVNVLVSVIVPVYNCEAYIKEAIDSLLNQSHKLIEIIVVYDESTDNTLRILEEYGEKIFLIKQEKTNLPTARNRGIKEAKGSFIAFCDGDDAYETTKIQKQLDIFYQNPNVDLTYTDTVKMDAKGSIIGEVISPEWNRKYWLSHRFITVSSVMVRMELLKDIEKKYNYVFDESITVCEDFDLFIRLSEITEFKRCPGNLTYFRLRPGGLSRGTWLMNITRLRIFKRYGMYYQFVRSLIIDIPSSIINNFYISRKYIDD